MHHWIKTNQGRVEFRPDGPKMFYPSREALAADIHTSLSAQKRCLGRMNWSVAEHSVALAAYMSRSGASLETILAALFHDAHEAFLGDIPYPLVASWPRNMREFVEATKHRIDLQIMEQMGPKLFEGADWDAIEKADKRMFEAEFAAFIPCDTQVVVDGRGSLDLMKAATAAAETEKQEDINRMLACIDSVRATRASWQVEVWRVITAMDAKLCGWFEEKARDD